MAVFLLYTLKPKDYRILFKINNKIEFASKPLDTRVECLKMIRLIRSKCHKDAFYKVKKLNCGSWCFDLVEPSNKDVLGRSKTYKDKTTVLNKISHMKANAQKAKFQNG